MTQHMPPRTSASRSRPRSVAVGLAAVALAVAACGGDSDDGDGLAAEPTEGAPAGDVERTIEVVMTDNEFSPGAIEVAEGETVRLSFSNQGAVVHDAVVGDGAAQDDHEEEMRADESGSGEDGGGMHHGGEAEPDDEAPAITVEPGETGELVHTFSGSDGLLIGCHEPGHYDAGMRIEVTVT